ncbi:hypothetical protein ACIQ7N_20095 [Lysinibacillus sp. NPDC095746]|uniref:hypothetical protein n=1 Tax=Lysinibacillus sp. NPDC095746 TaxID=3364134 RepID=UPI00380FE113
MDRIVKAMERGVKATERAATAMDRAAKTVDRTVKMMDRAAKVVDRTIKATDRSQNDEVVDWNQDCRLLAAHQTPPEWPGRNGNQTLGLTVIGILLT